MENWQHLIRAIPDFPTTGVTFRDITPLLRHAEAFNHVIDILAEPHRQGDIDVVAAIESRGFMFGAPLALRLGAGFVPIRKHGKLPAETIIREYSLEYGTGLIEMHCDALQPGDRVLVVDDVLATGGTARAAIEMVDDLGGKIVEVAFVIELPALGGRKRLPEAYPVRALTEY